MTGPIVLEGVVYALLGEVLGIALSTAAVMRLALVPTEGNDALEMLGNPTLSPVVAWTATAVLGVNGIAAGYFPARHTAPVIVLVRRRWLFASGEEGLGGLEA